MYLSDGEPFVPRDIVDYLEEYYNTHELLSRKKEFMTADEHLGYMKGVIDIVSHLKSLAMRKDSDNDEG